MPPSKAMRRTQSEAATATVDEHPPVRHLSNVCARSASTSDCRARSSWYKDAISSLSMGFSCRRVRWSRLFFGLPWHERVRRG